MITVASIQIGQVRTLGDPTRRDLLGRRWTTGFYKHPITTPVRVNTLGILGDAVADTKNHGGPDKAVLCYARCHYEAWAREHPELSMSGGALGENLTLDGADETTVCLGDRYQIGECELQVSQPRQPCWKIARRWGVKTLTKEVAVSGRTGWYLRVVHPGIITPGDTLDRVERPHPAWSVSRANDILFGREVDRAAVIELMAIPELAAAWKASIA